jgi:hypothetical protein
MITKKSAFWRTKRLCIVFILGLSFLFPSLLQAVNLCVTDNHGQTFFFTVKPKLKAGAISSIVGWVNNGAYFWPIHGSAIVNASGTAAKISLEHVNHVGSQRVGIGMDTDLKLNGTGSYQNINNGTYDIVAETWTEATCPKTKPVFGSVSASELGESIVMTPPITVDK